MDKKKLSYTYEEAAASTGLSARYIRQLVAAGDIAVKYAGTKPLIQATELEAWLDALPSEAPGR